MSKVICSILGLISCGIFLVANITFDVLDNPNPDLVYPEDKGLADTRIYFVPLFAMISILIICCYHAFKNFGKWHKVLWFIFVLLSISQTTKNIFFDATVRTYNDYVALAFILVYLISRLKSKNGKSENIILE